MIKKLSLYSLSILGLSSIFFACEDASVLDVSPDNIDKIPDVTVVSVEAKSSIAEVGDLSSEEGASVDAGSSTGTSITLVSSAALSQGGNSSETDLFNSSTGTSVDAGSSTGTSVDAGSSTALSSVDAGSSTSIDPGDCTTITQWSTVKSWADYAQGDTFTDGSKLATCNNHPAHCYGTNGDGFAGIHWNAISDCN